MRDTVVIIPSSEGERNLELLKGQLASLPFIRGQSVEIWGEWIKVVTSKGIEFAHTASNLPGISYVLVGFSFPGGKERAPEAVLEVAQKYIPGDSTFNLKVLESGRGTGTGRSGDKESAGDLSNYITSKLVDLMHKRNSFPTDVSPQFELWLLIGKDSMFVSPMAVNGAGGAPSGSAGSCSVMFSGGPGSLVAALEVNKAGFKPILCHGLTEDAPLSRLRSVVFSAALVRRSIPGKEFNLHIFRIPSFGSGIGRRESMCLAHAFVAECTSYIGRKMGATAISAGLDAHHTKSGLIDIYARHSDGLHVLYPNLSLTKANLLRMLPIGIFHESDAEGQSTRLVCQANKIDALFNKLSLSDLVNQAVSHLVSVQVDHPSAYHETLDRTLRMLRNAGLASRLNLSG